MITDDARTVDPKACQVESWLNFNRSNTEIWSQPSCSPVQNVELAVGGARSSTSMHGESRTVALMGQGKLLFKPLEPGGWSWGIVAGNMRRPNIHTDRNLIGDLYAYLPFTFAMRNDTVFVHANLGWLHERVGRTNRMSWGLGTEAQLTRSTWLMAETFGQDQGNPYYQLGVRYWVVPDRVQVDATYGNRMGSSSREQWVSVGLRLLSLPFLP